MFTKEDYFDKIGKSLRTAMRNYRIITSFFIFYFLLFALSYAQKKGVIQIKGSDTMVNLVQAWAERFMEKNPEIFVSVTGGGSGTGIASFLNKTCAIAASSREMKAKEIDLAKSKGVVPKEYIVGYDGIAVVVHPKNPVDKLTLNQIKDIFMGKIDNWSQLGGQDKKIVILSREVNSGTHIYFKEHVLENGDFSPQALLLPSSQAIADEVALNPDAIGYYGMGYLSDKQKAVSISLNGKDYFSPTLENIMAGRYPVSRPLFFYIDGEPEGEIKDFIDFVLSEEGQSIVSEQDFVPLKK
ncbi:MAG: phosphate ABC transporter substrate-binding protein [Candidatus Omnitrophica bacterium]|nr:phosphate ABC transporter substrate-binding protein [Candidatus Omnitrophota bacterium]MCM8798748.1 phosphate ABC transporter substrate-binding protein [Candidatus Omnitrophota bacterium]